MEHTRFIGLDIHKERISVAVAESGRSGAVEYLGEIADIVGCARGKPANVVNVAIAREMVGLHLVDRLHDSIRAKGGVNMT
jgi:hypothetical protein